MAECMDEVRAHLKDLGFDLRLPSLNRRGVADALDELPESDESVLDVIFADDGTLLFILPAAQSRAAAGASA